MEKTPLSKEVIDKLSVIYFDSDKFRVVTDGRYNILWKSFFEDDRSITFFDKVTTFPEDGVMCRILVGNTIMSAECEVLNIENTKVYMWTVQSPAEIAAHLDSFNTYSDITFLFNTLKSNVDSLRLWVEKKTKRISGSDKQLAICSAMTEQITLLEKLSSVMYDRKQAAVEIYSLILGAVNASNRYLDMRKHCITVLTMQELTLNSLLISGETYMLSSVLLCMIKRTVRFSCKRRNMLFISHDEKKIIISTKYKKAKPYARGGLTDSFELSAAKMYIEFIGGKFDLRRRKSGEQIKVTIPITDQQTLFNSDAPCLTKKEFDNLAKIILADI